MKDSAEIIKVRYYSYTMYQVNLFNPRTGKYYNSMSSRFESKDAAMEYIKELGVELKKVKA